MFSNIDIEILNSLTLTELGVLRYFDANKKSLLDMSVQAVADANFVSTATVIRLAKKLGYSGFSELKFQIREELRKQSEVNKSLTFESIVDEHIDNILNTRDLINKSLILDVVNKMNKADNIHFFGKGLTNSITSYYSKILFTLGINNYIYEDTHIAYLAAEKMNKKDLVFIVSLSGNTNQAIRMAQIAKSRKATIISITSNTSNTLSTLSDVQLTFCASEQSDRVADSVSRTPSLFLFDIIVEVFIAKRENLNI